MRGLGITVDDAGAIYIADYSNHVIRLISTDGMVTTFAGSPGAAAYADGTASVARLNLPFGVAFDRSTGNIVVGDRRLVRSASSPDTYTVDTIAAPPRVQLSTPTTLAVHGGFIYMADTNNHVVCKIATTSPYAASVFARTVGISGSSDGTGSAARFNLPRGVAVDGMGILYVSDTSNNTIRKTTSDQRVTRLAGYPNPAEPEPTRGAGAPDPRLQAPGQAVRGLGFSWSPGSGAWSLCHPAQDFAPKGLD
jgi:hypothetical protein